MYSTWGELKRAEASWTVITTYPCFLCKVPGLHQDAGYHHAPCSALQLGSSLAQFTRWWSYVEPGESCHHLSVKTYSSITTGNIYWAHTFTLNWTLPVVMRTRAIRPLMTGVSVTLLPGNTIAACLMLLHSWQSWHYTEQWRWRHSSLQ